MERKAFNIFMVLLLIAGILTSCSGDNLEAEIVSGDLLTAGSTMNVSGEGSTDNVIPVEANCAWTVTTDANWITITQPSAGRGNGSQSVVFNISPSTLSTSQTGTITIKTNGGIERIVTVNQRPGTIVLMSSPLSLFFTYEGGEQTLEITSNSHWTATSSVDWLKINNVKTFEGDGNQRLTIHADVNNNSDAVIGAITLTDEDRKVTPMTIQVEVGGRTPMLIVTPANEVEAAGGVAVFGVESNFNWKASVSALSPEGTETEKWAVFSNGAQIISGNPGNEPVEVSMTVGANTSLEERVITVTVTTESPIGDNKKETVTIRQRGASLPMVYLPKTTDVGMNEATLTFDAVTSSFPITKCGLLYSSDPNVVTGTRMEGTLNGETTKVQLTNLTSGTTYYVRAYATSAAGTGYSEVMSFKTRQTPGRNDNPTP